MPFHCLTFYNVSFLASTFILHTSSVATTTASLPDGLSTWFYPSRCCLLFCWLSPLVAYLRNTPCCLLTRRTALRTAHHRPPPHQPRRYSKQGHGSTFPQGGHLRAKVVRKEGRTGKLSMSSCASTSNHGAPRDMRVPYILSLSNWVTQPVPSAHAFSTFPISLARFAPHGSTTHECSRTAFFKLGAGATSAPAHTSLGRRGGGGRRRDHLPCCVSFYLFFYLPHTCTTKLDANRTWAVCPPYLLSTLVVARAGAHTLATHNKRRRRRTARTLCTVPWQLANDATNASMPRGWASLQQTPGANCAGGLAHALEKRAGRARFTKEEQAHSFCYARRRAVCLNGLRLLLPGMALGHLPPHCRRRGHMTTRIQRSLATSLPSASGLCAVACRRKARLLLRTSLHVLHLHLPLPCRAAASLPSLWHYLAWFLPAFRAVLCTLQACARTPCARAALHHSLQNTCSASLPLAGAPLHRACLNCLLCLSLGLNIAPLTTEHSVPLIHTYTCSTDTTTHFLSSHY